MNSLLLRLISRKTSGFDVNSSRTYTTKVQPKGIDTIAMSYASYESTQTSSEVNTSPLLVMHDLFGSKANWSTLCKEFHRKTVPQRKIIAVDARNHGDSPHSDNHTYEHLAEDIRKLLSELRIRKTSLLGHSMGGRAVMYFALKYPELVDKLLVADMSPVTTSSSFKLVPILMANLLRVNLPRDVTMSSARLNADMQLSRSISDRGMRSFVLSNLVQRADGRYAWRVNLRALLRNFSKYIVRFPEVTGCTFTGPVLFVAGGSSDYIQKADHAPIMKLFPRAEFKSVEGAGHWLHSERPVEFLTTCLEFLNRNTPD